jgi:hypothetical protein
MQQSSAVGTPQPEKRRALVKIEDVASPEESGASDRTYTPIGVVTFLRYKIRDTFNFRRRHGADNLDSDRRIRALRRVVPAAKYRG